MAEEKVISIKIDTTANIKDIGRIEQLLKEITKQRAELNQKVKDGNDLTDEEVKRLGQLTIRQKELNSRKTDLIKQTAKQNSLYGEESKRLNELRKQYKDLVLKEGKATKETSELLKEIQDLDKKLKDIDASVGQFQRSVGDYGKQALGSAKDTAKFALALFGLKGGLEDVDKAFTSNQEGSEETRTLMSQVSAVSETFFNRLGRLGSELIKNVKNAKGFNGSLQALLYSIDDVGKAFKGVTEEAAQNAKAAEEAEKATIALEKSSRGLKVQLAVVNGEFEKQNAIAGDNTRSFNEQEEAAKKAQRLQIERVLILNQIAEEELKIIDEKIKARSKDANNLDLLNDRAEKAIELQELQNELTVAGIENQKLLREIQRDRFEKELDYAIDAFDGVKTINERLLSDERLTFEQREKLLDETTALAESSFNNQIKLVEGFTGKKLQLDELVKENDEQVIRERLNQYQLDEITLTRILEIIRERKFVTQDLADAEKDLTDAKIEQFKINKEALDGIAAENRAFEIERLEFQKDFLKERNELTLKEEARLSNEIFERKKADLIETAMVQLENEELTADQRLEINNQLQNDIERIEWERIKSIAERERAINKERADAALASYAQIKSLASSLNQFEINALKEKRKQGLITETQYQKKLQEQKRKEFEQSKKFGLIDVAISTAQGIAGALADYPYPYNIVVGALVGAAGAAQAAAINSQQFETTEFAEGGLLSGASHAQGGIPFTIQGQSGYEAEGGEAIINKKSTSMFLPLLSAINQAGGGVAFDKPANAKRFALGGLTPNIPTNGTDINGLINAINSRIDNIKVINVATDTAQVANRVNNIQSNATFG